MATTFKAASRDRDALFYRAEKVFSKGLVDMVRDSGSDFLEAGGEGSFVFDSEGNRLLDCYTSAGTFNLGRRNHEIVERLRRAVYDTDQGNFVMPSQEKAHLARRIAEFMPSDLDCVLFGVTRGESMDAAAKLARGFTGRSGLVTVDGGCYGETGFALSLSERKGKEQFGALIPGVKTVPFGDIKAAIEAIDDKTAAFVAEPIQAENHCRTASAGYFARIRALCSLHGAVLIFDETQSGFGRTGKGFAFEHSGVIPDIAIVGEAITGGLFPMTAMVFTPELKGFFDAHPLIHLCTFGGHDLGCSAAMAALDEYDCLKPWINAGELVEAMIGDLAEYAAVRSGPLVSVAGEGLLMSLKFASSGDARRFCRLACGNGLLARPGEVDPSAVPLRPSLLITPSEAVLITGTVMKVLDMM
jgi:putrescine aminotransferase